MSQLNDVESHNIDKLMRSLRLPAFLRWYWVRTASRDNSRTPVQWDASPGAGFTGGTPWLGINANHVSINYSDQQGREDSVLSYYKKMIALRASSETLKYGVFEPAFAKAGVMAYTRTLGTERYITILNFSKKPARAGLDSIAGNGAGQITADVSVAASNIGRETFNGSLEPWEAIVLLYK